jgi:hypothetical protein
MATESSGDSLKGHRNCLTPADNDPNVLHTENSGCSIVHHILKIYKSSFVLRIFPCLLVVMYIKSAFRRISLHGTILGDWKHIHLKFWIQCFQIPNFLRYISITIHINLILQIHISSITNICTLKNRLRSFAGPNNEVVYQK